MFFLHGSALYHAKKLFIILAEDNFLQSLDRHKKILATPVSNHNIGAGRNKNRLVFHIILKGKFLINLLHKLITLCLQIQLFLNFLAHMDVPARHQKIRRPALIIKHAQTEGNPTNLSLLAADSDIALFYLIRMHQFFHNPSQLLPVFAVNCIFKIVRQYLDFLCRIADEPKKFFISFYQLPALNPLNHRASGRQLLNRTALPAQPLLIHLR